MDEAHRLTVTGRYENIPTVATFVATAAEDAGLDSQAVFHCRLAVEEACANIIEHAYGGQDKGHIYATIDIENKHFIITLVDNGTPFDPQSVPPPRIESDIAKMKPGGLGLHFMYQVMDEVTFSFQEKENRLTLVKYF